MQGFTNSQYLNRTLVMEFGGCFPIRMYHTLESTENALFDWLAIWPHSASSSLSPFPRSGRLSTPRFPNMVWCASRGETRMFLFSRSRQGSPSSLPENTKHKNSTSQQQFRRKLDSHAKTWKCTVPFCAWHVLKPNNFHTFQKIVMPIMCASPQMPWRAGKRRIAQCSLLTSKCQGMFEGMCFFLFPPVA